MSFRDDWNASRRLFILRLLVEVGGEANESNIARAAFQGGFTRDTREDIRADLDRLRELRCITEEYFDARVCVVKVTRRGDDAAHGRVEVAGVEQSRWER